jgi:hypothetical protein
MSSESARRLAYSRHPLSDCAEHAGEMETFLAGRARQEAPQ